MNRDVKCHEVPNTPGPFLVDGFKHVATRPKTRSFFLSHFHSDHYGGLRESFDAGTIYCSQITAKLVVEVLHVPPSRLKPMPLGQKFEVEGVTVTFVEANHCPGAVLILFETPAGYSALHCGDMRYAPSMRANSTLQRICGNVDDIFLDTTYGASKHDFPTQEESIAQVCEAVIKSLGSSCAEGTQPLLGAQDAQSTPNASPTTALAAAAQPMHSCLILLGAYTIGKEKLLLGVARATGLQIFVDEEKYRILRCLDLPKEDLCHFTTCADVTPLHVCKLHIVGEVWPFFKPGFASIERYIAQRGLSVRSALGVLPTGWADSSKWNRAHALQERQRDNGGKVAVLLAPYSEHSNYSELTAFVQWLKPTRVVPTVFSDAKHAKKLVKYFNRFCNSTEAKRKFLSTMFGGAKRKQITGNDAGPRSRLKMCDDDTRETMLTADPGTVDSGAVLSQLEGMGFSKILSSRALQSANGDLNKAVQTLLYRASVL